MAFYKFCVCGENIVFEKILGYPDTCPSCGRKLVDFMTYDENDPYVDELMKRNSVEDIDIKEESDSGKMLRDKRKYILKLSNGKEISIPEEGCVIGRSATGAEELAEFSSVSRQHLRVMPRRNIGVIIEDISSYGTIVDGQRVVKNSPVRVTEGSKIILCDLETVLIIKEAND
mgnify:CR=1 FL=1